MRLRVVVWFVVALIAWGGAWSFGGIRRACATDYFVDPNYHGVEGANNTFSNVTTAFATIPSGASSSNPHRGRPQPGSYSQQLPLNHNTLDIIGLGGGATLTDNLNANTPKP